MGIGVWLGESRVPGAGRLDPETWPQFLALPPQCGPVEAEEEEPSEQDWGEDSGEGPWGVPSAFACLPGTGGD